MADKPDFETMTASEVVDLVEDAIGHLGVEHLTRIISRAEERRKERQDEARETILHEFEERAREMGFTLEALFPQTSGRRKRTDAGQPLSPKYRHPDDPSLTWPGRGQKPKWLRDLEAAGHKKEEFLIPAEEGKETS